MSNSPQPPDRNFTLRTHRPGDIGWIIHRHGILYYQEYGWDERFEGLVASIAAEFIKQYDPQAERCWIAEQGGHPIGCIMLVRDRPSQNTAKLRLLLVEPSARGLGVARSLVRQCRTFAEEVGYERIVLWTNQNLTSARRLYSSEGYRCVHEEEHETIGIKLVGETWELDLKAPAT